MKSHDEIEGLEAERVLLNTDLGNGFASYAKADGRWFSVNLLNAEIITDVRWEASAREVEQITTILELRRRRAVGQ